eukprot:352783-Chlamydomonas_euryale.AAC.2
MHWAHLTRAAAPAPSAVSGMLAPVVDQCPPGPVEGGGANSFTLQASGEGGEGRCASCSGHAGSAARQLERGSSWPRPLAAPLGCAPWLRPLAAPLGCGFASRVWTERVACDRCADW